MIIHGYELFYKIRVTFILLCFGQINLYSNGIFSQGLEIFSNSILLKEETDFIEPQLL